MLVSKPGGGPWNGDGAASLERERAGEEQHLREPHQDRHLPAAAYHHRLRLTTTGCGCRRPAPSWPFQNRDNAPHESALLARSLALRNTTPRPRQLRCSCVSDPLQRVVSRYEMWLRAPASEKTQHENGQHCGEHIASQRQDSSARPHAQIMSSRLFFDDRNCNGDGIRRCRGPETLSLGSATHVRALDSSTFPQHHRTSSGSTRKSSTDYRQLAGNGQARFPSNDGLLFEPISLHVAES